MDKKVENPAVRSVNSRAVATPQQIREAGLVLQGAISAYATTVGAANTAVGAIDDVVSAMNFKGLDGDLPTQANLKAQIIAFNALPTQISAKPALSVSASIAAVNS